MNLILFYRFVQSCLCLLDTLYLNKWTMVIVCDLMANLMSYINFTNITFFWKILKRSFTVDVLVIRANINLPINFRLKFPFLGFFRIIIALAKGCFYYKQIFQQMKNFSTFLFPTWMSVLSFKCSKKGSCLLFWFNKSKIININMQQLCSFSLHSSDVLLQKVKYIWTAQEGQIFEVFFFRMIHLNRIRCTTLEQLCGVTRFFGVINLSRAEYSASTTCVIQWLR